MKYLMNRLGMVAVALALGVVGYLVVSHFSAKNVESVAIQRKHRTSGNKCNIDNNCPHGHCVDHRCVKN